MGWEMHITRAEHVWDGESHPIFPEEWIQHVNNDSELSFDPKNGQYHVLWRGNEINWLDWDTGNISTTSPGQELYCKMLDIAAALNAKVLDDDGRVYLLPDDLFNPSWAKKEVPLSFLQKIITYFRK
ncbi:hypothetical protein RJE46_00540 [Cedecea neteri]|uniref:Uncharacterized protein n=2 Tax=Cedecea neteri TaxID=158822 RepID=A0AAN0VS68_9ENTR|nr:hypothetical protein [Cedecea neteri]AIR59902.1 hypothetical protein LH23_04305 [Cedecea neteri]NIG79461.1 hypothetical protein [Klebsiella sp. Ap-873]WNJ79780.1 hypothetical protein RJE46_00540 [Cedecea neteri]